jgi:hypothetical protein
VNAINNTARQKWTDAVHKILCTKLAANLPEEERNMRDLAEGIAENYTDEEIKTETPEDAVELLEKLQEQASLEKEPCKSEI